VKPIAAGNARKIRILFFAAGVSLLAVEALALSGIAPAPHRFLALDPNAYHPFFAWAVAGIFAVHAIVHGLVRHVLRASLIGACLLALHGVALGFGGSPAWMLAGTAAYYQGVGSTLVLAGLAWSERGAATGNAFALTLMAGCLMPLFVVISRFFLALSAWLYPATFDAALYRFDASLGFQPAMVVTAFVLGSETLRQLGLLAYAMLPLAIAVAGGMQLQQRRDAANVLVVFMAMAAVGFLIYLAYPAAGPAYLLGDRFPDRLPDPDALALFTGVVMPAPRNAMPSLHMAWALALWFGARTLSAGARLGFGAFAALTVLATLGLGEHYLIDLIVALPFALAVQAACTPGKSREKRLAFRAGTALTFGWLVYLLVGAGHFASVGRFHALPIGLTLLLSLHFERRLARSHSPAEWITIAIAASGPSDTTAGVRLTENR
jgi:hypothetical protein